jgi:hypothetical protein
LSDNPWLNNDSVKERVRTLLRGSGLHLELDVESICQRLVHEWNHKLIDSVSVSSIPITYSTAAQPQLYREVDQVFQFYDEVAIGEFTGIQLIVDCPIECKYRKDAIHFAYSVKGIDRNFPVVGFVGSQLLTQALTSADRLLANFLMAKTASVIIKNEQTPNGLFDEALVYNAAGALYDYIEAQHHVSDHVAESDILRKQLEDFDQYVNDSHYYWQQVLKRWTLARPQSVAKDYYDSYFSGRRHYDGIHISLPIVCLNGSLFHASDASETASFIEIPNIITSIRKNGWPNEPKMMHYSSSGVVPAIVTNPRGLTQTLETVRDFFLEFRECLISADPDIEIRWPIECDLYAGIVAKYFSSAEEPFRSNLHREAHL